ncbi:hypothetical protein [Aquisalimonas asiatica]|uniref:Uncharacterized protein n=1 Tax=Aquisalimonas asiatica TaxID=406100 RepID=A0A1H8TEX5_9GAMM|nr:hypothetical protein [Aquisalimonas asiatica]SEO89472.1 hypothetical protein SAMN04488052_104122 [Aquisalimonas asiatica]
MQPAEDQKHSQEGLDTEANAGASAPVGWLPGSRYLNGFLLTAMVIHALVIIWLGYMFETGALDRRVAAAPVGVLQGVQATAAGLFVGVAIILAGYPRVGAIISGLSSFTVLPLAMVGIAGAVAVWTRVQMDQPGAEREDTPTRAYPLESDIDTTVAIITLSIGALLFALGTLPYLGSLFLGLGILRVGICIAARKRPVVCLYDDTLSILESPVRSPHIIRLDQITRIDEDNTRITIHVDQGGKFRLRKQLLDDAHVEELVQVLKDGKRPTAPAGDGFRPVMAPRKASASMQPAAPPEQAHNLADSGQYGGRLVILVGLCLAIMATWLLFNGYLVLGVPLAGLSIWCFALAPEFRKPGGRGDTHPHT